MPPRCEKLSVEGTYMSCESCEGACVPLAKNSTIMFSVLLGLRDVALYLFMSSISFMCLCLECFVRGSVVPRAKKLFTQQRLTMCQMSFHVSLARWPVYHVSGRPHRITRPYAHKNI